MARIVIVDDDELFCDLVGEGLANAGHIVSVYHEGKDAVAAIHSSQPDVLILDYNLPGISGLEILRQVRDDKRARHTSVTILTREDGRLLKARANRDGADYYLVKPCTADTLVRHVDALLAARSIVQSAS